MICSQNKRLYEIACAKGNTKAPFDEDLQLKASTNNVSLNEKIIVKFLYKTEVYSDFNVPLSWNYDSTEYWHHKTFNIPYYERVTAIETIVKFDNIDNFLYVFYNGTQIHFNNRGKCEGLTPFECNFSQTFHTKSSVKLDSPNVNIDLLLWDSGNYAILSNLTYHFIFYYD